MTVPRVLITGASAGLGLLFAQALAREGRDLVIVARREDRLTALAASLRADHKVAVLSIALDLAEADAPARLFAAMAQEGIMIDTLINNAGFGALGGFGEMDGAMQAGMIDLNCRALVMLCHLALPGMRARGSGAILNLASVAAFVPGPWMAVYYATKAFVLSFSEALHEEMKDSGIIVSALCPGPTRTEFAQVAGMGSSPLFTTFAADADGVVRDGLAALKSGKAVKVSGVMNAMTTMVAGFMPRALVRVIAGRLQKTRT
ncbi:SDR family oxidoreductase [soil metagenome]